MYINCNSTNFIDIYASILFYSCCDDDHNDDVRLQCPKTKTITPGYSDN